MKVYNRDMEKRPSQVESKKISRPKNSKSLQEIPQTNEIQKAISQLLSDGAPRTQNEICMTLAGRFTYERVLLGLEAMLIGGAVRAIERSVPTGRIDLDSLYVLSLVNTSA